MTGREFKESVSLCGVCTDGEADDVDADETAVCGAAPLGQTGPETSEKKILECSFLYMWRTGAQLFSPEGYEQKPRPQSSATNGQTSHHHH